MENTIHLFMLIGAWGDQENDGVDVLEVSESSSAPAEKMESIARNRAADFQKFGAELEESISNKHYEICDSDGRYARFYVVERDIKLSSDTTRRIAIEMEKADRQSDVEEHLRDLFDGGNVPAWKYWYVKDNQKVIDEILALIDSMESCNAAYNTTLEIAVDDTLDDIELDVKVLTALWDKFGEVPINDKDDILEEFMDFPEGTNRFEVLNWFDDHTPRGIAEFIERVDNEENNA